MDSIYEEFFISSEPDRAVFLTPKQTYTMRGFCACCDALCRQMVQFGVVSGSRIAVSTADGIHAAASFLSAARLGAAILFLPPNVKEAEQKTVFEQFHPQWHLTRQGCFRLPDKSSSDSGYADEVIFRTGGTSGRVKWVRISSQSMLERAKIRHSYEEPAGSGLKLSAVPPWHMVGMLELLRALFLNITTVVPDAWNVEALLTSFHTNPITNLVTPSHVLARLFYHDAFRIEDFQHIRIIRYCLEPLPTETLIQAQSLFSSAQLFSDYSLTEAVGTISILTPEEHRISNGNYLPSSGRFLPGIEARVVDAQGHPVSFHMVGELTVHTPWQFIGYLGENQAEYWIRTGDMIWVDESGRFSLSGFHAPDISSSNGDLYVLPATAKRNYLNAPPVSFYPSEPANQLTWLEQYHRILMLLHSSLDVEEIKRTYLTTIQSVIRADAYGLELFPLNLASAELASGKGTWYQDALWPVPQESTILYPAGCQLNDKGALPLSHLEQYLGTPIDVLYIPLYSQTAHLHGIAAFARGSTDRFTAQEITLVKQLTHHLNLSLLNARMYQELEERQALVQQVLDHTQVGALLSSRSGTVYYMNNVFEDYLDREFCSPVRLSAILNKVHEHVLDVEQTGNSICTTAFTCYFKPNQQPARMRMRTIQLDPQSNFLATFLSPDLDEDNVSFGNLDQVLTAREKEVLSHLCHGLSYKEIAQTLCISLNTVNFHIKQIYRKMEVTSRSELVKRVLYLGTNELRYLPWTNGP